MCIARREDMPAVQLAQVELELGLEGNLSFDELCAGVGPGHDEFLSMVNRQCADIVEMEEDINNCSYPWRELSMVA